MPTFKTVSNLVDKAQHIDRVWEILSKAYSEVEGGFLFNSKVSLISETDIWRLAFRRNRLIAVTVFKKKHGLKLVAFSADKTNNTKRAIQALTEMIARDLKWAWMEVSEKAEHFILSRCGGEHYLLHNSHVTNLMKKKVELSHDGYHYRRNIADIFKEKIMIGTPIL